MRREKGITLIALIITIVVMLILVAVSVNVIIKSNLIGTAEKTVDKYKTASEEESNMSQIEINGKKYDSIEDYLAGVESIPEIHNWVRTGDNIKCEHCNTSLTIGQKVNYTKTGAGVSTIAGDKSGVSNGITKGDLNAEDYGEKGSQTIHSDSETKWVVLGVEDSNKNGTNETLLLTTQTPTTGKIKMYGSQPYNHAVDEINRMCKEIYGTDARGMTIEDVNACVQYTAPAGMCGKKEPTTNKWTYYTVPEGTKISDLGSSYGDIWTDIQNNTYQEEDGTKKYFTPNCPEGTTDSSVLGNIPVDGYLYVADSTVGAPTGIPVLPDSTTTATKTLIFGTNNSNMYWLASRGVCADSGCAGFGPGAVGGGCADSVGGGSLFDSIGVSDFIELPLRCVVSLRSDIPAVVADSGSGKL